MFLETVRAESLIPMPPQMEDAIFGMNSNFYIKEVSNEKKVMQYNRSVLFLCIWSDSISFFFF